MDIGGACRDRAAALIEPSQMLTGRALPPDHTRAPRHGANPASLFNAWLIAETLSHRPLTCYQYFYGPNST